MKIKKIHPWILNIGSGKLSIDCSDYIENNKNYTLVNIDKNFFSGDNPHDIDNSYKTKESKHEIFYCRYDIIEFLERTIIKFDLILIHRFFEHINRDKLLYFIYLLSTVTNKDSIIDIISPNYKILSNMILYEDTVNDPDFDKKDIIISTELFNESHDSHQNITTPERIKRLFEYEGRFELIDFKTPYRFDERDIYFWALIKRENDK